ncbi:hypothetical protein BJ741DRAFT_583804 [Chytriomyces cf. hyalinus JEL632]|nr:hypothetical protein BJ741DRAFT_583804 [Chytriomyces cf. hyalinus JEL632]
MERNHPRLVQGSLNLARAWGANYDFQPVIAVGYDTATIEEGVNVLQWIQGQANLDAKYHANPYLSHSNYCETLCDYVVGYACQGEVSSAKGTQILKSIINNPNLDASTSFRSLAQRLNLKILKSREVSSADCDFQLQGMEYYHATKTFTKISFNFGDHELEANNSEQDGDAITLKLNQFDKYLQLYCPQHQRAFLISIISSSKTRQPNPQFNLTEDELDEMPPVEMPRESNDENVLFEGIDPHVDVGFEMDDFSIAALGSQPNWVPLIYGTMQLVTQSLPFLWTMTLEALPTTKIQKNALEMRDNEFFFQRTSNISKKFTIGRLLDVIQAHGTGKSYVMDLISSFAKAFLLSQSVSVLLAPTEAAAGNVGASIVERVFKINHGASAFVSLKEQACHNCQKKFHHSIAMLLDEVLMWGQKLLGHTNGTTPFLEDLTRLHEGTVPLPENRVQSQTFWMERCIQFLQDENDKQILQDIHSEGILFAMSFNKEKDTHNSNYIRTFAKVVPIMATLVGPHAQLEKHAKAGTMKCIPRRLFLAVGTMNLDYTTIHEELCVTPFIHLLMAVEAFLDMSLPSNIEFAEYLGPPINVPWNMIKDANGFQLHLSSALANVATATRKGFH